MRPILVFFAVLSAVFSSAAIDKEPVLDLKFDQAQEFDTGKKKIVFDGRIQDGMMFFGSKPYSITLET